MKKAIIPVILTALSGCGYAEHDSGYVSPVQLPPIVIQRPRQVSHEDIVKWYRLRQLKSRHKSLEGAVAVSSEFMASVIDRQTFSPPNLKFDDWYPTYDFFPGDLLGFLCFHRNNETTAAHFMLYSPSGEMIDGKGFGINANDQIVGKTYDVSLLIRNYGEGVYAGKWFFHAIYVKTSLANLRR